MNDCEKYRGLLVGLLDQELTPEESRDVNEHLGRCAQCRREYEQLRETSGKLEAVTFAEPQDQVLEKLWRSPFSRLNRIGGLLLVLGGYSALIAFALYELLANNKESAWARISIAAIVLGFLLLLVQTVWERLKTYRKDPYKEIQR